MVPLFFAYLLIMEKIYKYHVLLRDIYDKMSTKWFRLSEYWEFNSLKDETKASAGSKMDSMVQYHDNNFYTHKRSSYRFKPFLLKRQYSEVENLFPNASYYEKRSNYWKVSDLGLIEIVNVFGGDSLKKEDSVIIAKFLLGGVTDSI